MSILYVDSFSGAAGDMLLAALLDAGLRFDDLKADLSRLSVGGYSLEVQRVTRHGLTGTHLQVHLTDEERPARTLPAIEAILSGSDLDEYVKVRSLAVFRRIAGAEAAVHGTTIDRIHFHEIGAVDSLVDIVGFCAGLVRLGVEAVFSSPLPLGGGTVRTEHGLLPAPAPATLAILATAGAPTVPGPAATELVTPTAAALLAELATFRRPPMTLRRVGYGFGTKEFDWPNAVRVWLGEAAAVTGPEAGRAGDQVVLLSCNLDDATGETLAYALERLLAAGALDAWFTPIQMKKNRPGVLISALARPEDTAVLANLLLRETPTLGVRHHLLQRSVAEREMREVETPWGVVRVKVKRIGGEVISASPEYEDCARLAREAGVTLRQVFDAVSGAAASR